MEKKMSAATGSSKASSSKASIPNNVKKTILNMKEITGSHTDDEIYVMLKECGMDPNEAIQRLLVQDPFREVKRKRDKKKENSDNNEPASRRTPNMHMRGNRGGKTNNSTCRTSHDTSGGRTALKEDARSQVVDKLIFSSQEKRIKEENTSVASSVHTKPKSSTEVISGDTTTAAILGSGIEHPISLEPGKAWISQGLPQHESTDKSSTVALEFDDVQRKPISTSSNDSASSAVFFSTSDPVLRPSDESLRLSAVGTIEREVGSQRSVETSVPVNKTRAAHEVIALPEPVKPQGNQYSQATELQSSASEVSSGCTGSRPSSNYSNHSQQAIGSQKGPSKEWKPKQVNIYPFQGSETPSAAEITAKSSDVFSQSQLSTGDSEGKVSKLQSKFEELHVKERKNVIIPTHIHVPESARFGLSFGSIDACFGVSTSNACDVDCQQNLTHFSKKFHEVEESVEERPLSNEIPAANVEDSEYYERPQSPLQVPENLSSGNSDVSSAAGPENNETPETFLPHGGAQYSVVQQPLNPLNYYAQGQLYQSVSDTDGRVSMFGPQGYGAKYENPAMVPPQASQSQLEVGNPLVQSNSAPASLVQTGVLQASPQHLLPYFLPPTGTHLSHYPPNYLPYSHYFPPYYLPGPPAIHQFLGNGAFPQQPLPAGAMYPPPTPPTTNIPATNIKYPFAQFKPGGYGPYGSSPPSGNPNNDDAPDSQFKEGNTYLAGQQSEGSAVWVTGPGPDMSNISVSSYYNLPQHPQGQHVAFTPTQSGHNAYANLYHQPGQAVTTAAMHPFLQPSQTMAGAPDMIVPPGNIYQQPSQPQPNWLNNY